jgi:hypothetical protein
LAGILATSIDDPARRRCLHDAEFSFLKSNLMAPARQSPISESSGASNQGVTTMLTKTKIALATALIIGTASAALANDSGENNQGGFVMPGSLVGVNPAYHPGIFGNPAAARSYGFAKSRHGGWHVRSDWHWGAHR